MTLRRDPEKRVRDALGRCRASRANQPARAARHTPPVSDAATQLDERPRSCSSETPGTENPVQENWTSCPLPPLRSRLILRGFLDILDHEGVNLLLLRLHLQPQSLENLKHRRQIGQIDSVFSLRPGRRRTYGNVHGKKRLRLDFVKP